VSPDLAPYVDRLLAAVSTRTGTAPLTDSFDLDEATALDVQDAVVAARVGAGHAVVGAKLGLTSKAKQQQMNVDRPLYGWLTADMALDTGAALQCSTYIQPRVEPEIAFLLGRDLEGPHVTTAQVLSATEACFGAIDVLDSRYAGYKFTFNDVTADNASSAGFVLGGVALDPYGLDLRLTGVVLEKNGELVSTAAGASVMGHPATAVAWLVRALARRGQGLEAGHVVMAGGMTEAIAVAPGDTVVATFDRLGSVEIACR
jgi:2-oxo-3-hexenedioate decarboxylase